jgi:hypothetical protein
MKYLLLILGGLLALTSGAARAADPPPATPAATVEYTIQGPEAPWPGLWFAATAPRLGWGGGTLQVGWDPGAARLTLYLPDGKGVSHCPPAAAPCYPTVVRYRFVQGWDAVAVLQWAPNMPWYFGYAGGIVPYAVAGDRLILQLPPQAAQ